MDMMRDRKGRRPMGSDEEGAAPALAPGGMGSSDTDTTFEGWPQDWEEEFLAVHYSMDTLRSWLLLGAIMITQATVGTIFIEPGAMQEHCAHDSPFQRGRWASTVVLSRFFLFSLFLLVLRSLAGMIPVHRHFQWYPILALSFITLFYCFQLSFLVQREHLRGHIGGGPGKCQLIDHITFNHSASSAWVLP